MNITFSTDTQIGKRHSNQDTTGACITEHSACFLVCDGVASHPGGELAALIARDTLLSLSHDRLPLDPAQTTVMIEKTDQAIREAQTKNPDLNQMSTTLAVLFIDRDNQRAWWVHAGDSRVYHFRRGILHGMTRDHSLVQRFQDEGHENTGINSNLLYNALGANGVQPYGYSPILALEDGDAFLICTDGFWHNLTPAEMEQALRMVNTPQEWLALMQKAIDRGEKQDNLSAVAVWCGAPQETTLLFAPTDAARFIPSRN